MQKKRERIEDVRQEEENGEPNKKAKKVGLAD